MHPGGSLGSCAFGSVTMLERANLIGANVSRPQLTGQLSHHHSALSAPAAEDKPQAQTSYTFT
jgi:hypothetical protein